MDQKNKTEIDFEIFDCEVDRGHELLIVFSRKTETEIQNVLPNHLECGNSFRKLSSPRTPRYES